MNPAQNSISKTFAHPVLLAVAFSVILNFGCQKSAANRVASESTDVIKKNQTQHPSTSAALKEEKWYADMNDTERLNFVHAESKKVLQKISGGDEVMVSRQGAVYIKSLVDGYAKRSNNKSSNLTCNAQNPFQDNLSSVLSRGQKVIPTITAAFKKENVSPQLGIYTAMIESEFCPCLQSPVGPVGMFQILKAQGAEFGLKVSDQGVPVDASDERCQPEPSSRFAAARFKKLLADDFRDEPGRYTFSVAAYNAGEGMTKKNISVVKGVADESPINFWTLLRYQNKLNKQFQDENGKYVTKFFAAAIVGENPTVFGEVEHNPLSEYANGNE